MKGEFVVVTGIGHCGTKWLSRVLDQPEQGMRFYHERKRGPRRIGRQEGDYWRLMEREQAELSGDYIDEYLSIMTWDLGWFRYVGDANSWAISQVPLVCKALPVTRVIVMVRDGVSQLHSIAKRSGFQERWLDVYAGPYWKRLRKPFGDYRQMTPWEKVCVWWALLPGMTALMASDLPGIKFETLRLEDLTQDREALRALTDSFGLKFTDAELAKWQWMDVHRHVTGDRTPARVYFEVFTEDDRGAYERICGPTAAKLGYAVPTWKDYREWVAREPEWWN